MSRTATLLLSLGLLAACQQGDGSDAKGAPGDLSDTRPYSEVGENEVLQFTGTEPFWGGEVAGGVLTYSTPENQVGEQIPVQRFAGRNGLSFTGAYGGDEFALLVTPGECSDGMSDRTYPFVATLRVSGETRHGCAWSEEHPFNEPQAP